ncbi:low-affinity phosphate transporter [Apophysomyces ossiformis]|uniref:Low-affinity phosphate transporter n=1 Tax=Apophysomyces ossiformis TaxID=679940 RepID=A0A8H7ES73_9FUNG|nr:low-affinity phosphate transporter [Apophysomyces ossiformis]
MKFAHSLVLNAVPEWIDQYVDYDHLKKIVYQVERTQVQQQASDQLGSVEEGYLESVPTSSVSQHNRSLFTTALNDQSLKIMRFFVNKEKELLDEASCICSQYEKLDFVRANMSMSAIDQEKCQSIACSHNSSTKISTAATRSCQTHSMNRFMQRLLDVLKITKSKNCSLPDDQKQANGFDTFRMDCASTYIELRELQRYVQLNKTAFEKILKKWDKLTGEDLRNTYYDRVVLLAVPFRQGCLDAIEAAAENIESMFSTVFTRGDVHIAKRDLQKRLQNHVEFKRNTVWKDMIGQERMTTDACAVDPQSQPGVTLLGYFIRRRTLIDVALFLLSLTVYIVLMCKDTLETKEASRCLALLLFAVLLWAFECIPLYATAYLIPLLIVPMDIIKLEGIQGESNAAAVADAVLSSMFNGTILILLGGFSIAAALSKHGIAQAFVTLVLHWAGTRPRWVILVNMYLAAFLSMWISNVAAPVLCFSLIQPILRTLPPDSTVGQCLIMGISLASCIGGLASPISSPQNIVAMQLMDPRPGWGLWFAASLPISFLTITVTWILLLLYFRPSDTTRIRRTKGNKRPRPTMSQIWVVLVCFATIALWCTESKMTEFWGNNGVIAFIPFLLFFGTHVLTQSDLNNFLWSVVLLAQGGMALGFAVEKSGLLDIIGHRIAQHAQQLRPLQILFVFGGLVLVFATFVSHTVAALIILPIVKQVGEQLPKPHPDLLVMGTAFVSSVAMGLPVSG